MNWSRAVRDTSPSRRCGRTASCTSKCARLPRAACCTAGRCGRATCGNIVLCRIPFLTGTGSTRREHGCSSGGTNSTRWRSWRPTTGREILRLHLAARRISNVLIGERDLHAKLVAMYDNHIRNATFSRPHGPMLVVRIGGRMIRLDATPGAFRKNEESRKRGPRRLRWFPAIA